MSELWMLCKHGEKEGHWADLTPAVGRVPKQAQWCPGGHAPETRDLISGLMELEPTMEVIFHGSWDYEVLMGAREAFGPVVSPSRPQSLKEKVKDDGP